jgi:hypothetical protein
MVLRQANLLPVPGFQTQTDQPTSGPYTHCAILAPMPYAKIMFTQGKKFFWLIFCNNFSLSYYCVTVIHLYVSYSLAIEIAQCCVSYYATSGFTCLAGWCNASRGWWRDRIRLLEPSTPQDLPGLYWFNFFVSSTLGGLLVWRAQSVFMYTPRTQDVFVNLSWNTKDCSKSNICRSTLLQWPQLKVNNTVLLLNNIVHYA